MKDLLKSYCRGHWDRWIYHIYLTYSTWCPQRWPLGPVLQLEMSIKQLFRTLHVPLLNPEVCQSISQPVQAPQGTTALRYFWVICIYVHVPDNSTPISSVSDCFPGCFRFCWEGLIWWSCAKHFLYASLTKVLWVAAVSAVMNVTKADPTTCWCCSVIAKKERRK